MARSESKSFVSSSMSSKRGAVEAEGEHHPDSGAVCRVDVSDASADRPERAGHLPHLRDGARTPNVYGGGRGEPRAARHVAPVLVRRNRYAASLRAPHPRRPSSPHPPRPLPDERAPLTPPL